MFILHGNAKSTPWLNETPTLSELKRCTIDQLLIICKYKKNFKPVLIDFLMKQKKIG